MGLPGLCLNFSKPDGGLQLSEGLSNAGINRTLEGKHHYNLDMNRPFVIAFLDYELKMERVVAKTKEITKYKEL